MEGGGEKGGSGGVGVRRGGRGCEGARADD